MAAESDVLGLIDDTHSSAAQSPENTKVRNVFRDHNQRAACYSHSQAMLETDIHKVKRHTAKVV